MMMIAISIPHAVLNRQWQGQGGGLSWLKSCPDVAAAFMGGARCTIRSELLLITPERQRLLIRHLRGYMHAPIFVTYYANKAE